MLTIVILLSRHRVGMSGGGRRDRGQRRQPQHELRVRVRVPVRHVVAGRQFAHPHAPTRSPRRASLARQAYQPTVRWLVVCVVCVDADVTPRLRQAVAKSGRSIFCSDAGGVCPRRAGVQRAEQPRHPATRATTTGGCGSSCRGSVTRPLHVSHPGNENNFFAFRHALVAFLTFKFVCAGP